MPGRWAAKGEQMMTGPNRGKPSHLLGEFPVGRTAPHRFGVLEAGSGSEPFGHAGGSSSGVVAGPRGFILP